MCHIVIISWLCKHAALRPSRKECANPFRDRCLEWEYEVVGKKCRFCEAKGGIEEGDENREPKEGG